MCMAATCQDTDSENPAHGGLIHFFKPSDIFFESKEDSLQKIE